jgi:hypothetical protein
MNYINDGLMHLEADYYVAECVLSSSIDDTAKYNDMVQSLITFREKVFGELKNNELDGRIYNEFVGMKTDLRQAFKYKNMTRQATIDIRACHPTFFGLYIYNYYIYNHVKSIGNKSNNAFVYKIEGTTDNSATTEPLKQLPDVKISDLNKEYNKWTELFTNPDVDAREIIAKEAGYEVKQVKQALNETINGCVKYKKLLKWIETHFPILYSIWQTTDVSKTGNNITKDYECELMLDRTLYKMTEEMNLKVI